jgi:DNA repair protein RecN (Recombination protein N)
VLRELHIQDLGVIQDVDLELHAGLNVLTGETGAGKTMVTVGLALVLGSRASASLVRREARATRVQARFDAPAGALEQGWSDGDELVLARSVSSDGRSVARIGGQLAPVSALASLAPDLVEFHGQHEGVRLLRPAAQTGFLDRYAGGAHVASVDALRAEHDALRSARARLEALVDRERDREREMDLLAYQVRELEAAAPRPGELDALEAEVPRLEHAERLVELAEAGEADLGADDAAADRLRAAAAALSAAAGFDERAAALADRAEELAAGAVELARDARAYRERLEVDPARLERVRDRIAALRGLARKYGSTEDEMLAFLEEARGRLRALAGAGEERDRLEREVRERGDRVAARAAAVSRGRRGAAPRLAAALRHELHDLGMQGVEVEVALVDRGELDAGGAERVELRFAGGPGQQLLPFAKVASGGELSRTMLACRGVLADLDDVPTLVFDEVDAGIGGRAGVAVGRRLAELARHRQVLVVTHLPQIASFADRHLRVEKVGGTASVEALDDEARVDELTRMLSGLPGSEAASTHAEELLAEAGRSKARR